ncbi:MAG: hypothetical protein SNJ82_14290 [Gemmataceae bacterium]
MSSSLNSLPEWERITNLLGSMRASGSGSRTTANAVSASAKLQAKKAVARKALRTPDGLPLGTQEVGGFLPCLNWANDPAKFPSPLIDSRGNVRLLRGLLPLSTYFGLVNWNNCPEAPAWPVREGAAVDVGLQASVESVFSGFSWGE